MRRGVFGIIAALLIALGGGTLRAQPKPAPFDQLFLRHEATGSAYELAIAQLAQARSARDDVKSYAGLLVNDHEAYAAALRDLAQQKGVTLPPGPTSQGTAKRDSLAALHGAEFDRAFIREARRVNGSDMSGFRQEASRTTDPDIRAFVAKYLPMDEAHARAADALAGTSVADLKLTRTPVIKPPSTSSNMPVIKPPNSDSAMPVIAPSTVAK